MESIRLNYQISGSPNPLQERGIKQAFLSLYGFAGASKEDHFVFTSSGAESINHAILAAYIDVTRKTGKNHFLCGALDEAPTIMSMSRLQDLGCLFQMVPTSSCGFITVKSVAEMITPRTAMLALSWANALTGVLQPLEDIALLCRERDILLLVDASHVLGKGDFSFESSGADIMSFNGPQGGMGGLFFRKEIRMSPMIVGGIEQGNLRAGSLAVGNLLEFAKWAEGERKFSAHYCTEIARLKFYFEQKLASKIEGARVLFQDQERVSHLTSLLFPGAASEALFYSLRQKGILTTFGGGSFQTMANLLKACSVVEPDCYCGLSFGLGPETTEQKLDLTADVIAQTVHHLKKCSAVFFLEE